MFYYVQDMTDFRLKKKLVNNGVYGIKMRYRFLDSIKTELDMWGSGSRRIVIEENSIWPGDEKLYE